jgi:V8-like Glu-specific endopeptidase
MPRKSRNAGHHRSPPVLPEQVIQWDNVLKGRNPPKELGTLKSSNSLVISRPSGDFKPGNALQKIDIGKKVSAWNFRPGLGVIPGLPSTTEGGLSRTEPGSLKPAGDHLNAYCPDWADRIFHPKLSPRNLPTPMRRRDGRRVRPHFIFGPDSRQPFFPTGYPLQCIGRLFVWNDASNPNWWVSGTATLVGKNVIVTAGHLMPWGSSSWKALFVPAYFNGSSTLGASVYAYCEAYQGYNPSGRPTAHDYAVLKLYDNLGDALGHFGCQSYDDNWNDGNYWTMIGYPGDVANAQQPSMQSGISFHDDDEDDDGMELESDNNASTPGDSGGPYWHYWSDGFPYVVGVDSGGEEEIQFPTTQFNNIAAGGPALTNLIGWAKATW